MHYPVQTFRLLRRFLRCMPVRDVTYLLLKPCLGKKRGETKAEVLSLSVEHAALKDVAAGLTEVADHCLEQVIVESRAERLRIQREAESSRASVPPSASAT